MRFLILDYSRISIFSKISPLVRSCGASSTFTLLDGMIRVILYCGHRLSKAFLRLPQIMPCGYLLSKQLISRKGIFVCKLYSHFISSYVNTMTRCGYSVCYSILVCTLLLKFSQSKYILHVVYFQV